MRLLSVFVITIALVSMAMVAHAAMSPLLAAPTPLAGITDDPDPGSDLPPVRLPGQPVSPAGGWQPPTNISDNAGQSGSPIVGVDNQGALHVAWYDDSPSNWDVLYASKTLTEVWTFPENVSSNASYSLAPSLITGNDGSVDIAWQDYGGPRIASQGTLLYKAKEQNQDFAPPQAISATSGFGGYPEVRDPHLSVDSTAGIRLTWAGATASGYRVYYARKQQGGDWTYPLVINPGVGASLLPRSVIDSSDVLHVVWQETAEGDQQSDILYAHQLADGGWAAPENISHNGGDSQEPALLLSADGAVHVVWRDYSINPDQAEILYATKPAGGVWSVPLNVSASIGDSSGPTLAEDVQGTLHLVWYDNATGNWEILYASKPLDGGWSGPENVSNTPGRSGHPMIFYDVSGRLQLVWADDTPGQFDIYYSSKVVPVFGTSFATGPKAALPGDVVAYTVVVRNASPSPVSLVVTHTVPLQTTYVQGSAAVPDGSITELADGFVWTGTVPAHGETRLTLRTQIDSGVPVGTVLRDQATIRNQAGDSVDVSASTAIMLIRVYLPLAVSALP